MKKVGVLAVLLASLLLTANAVAASGPSVWSTYVPVVSIGYADRYDVPYGCSAATGSCAQNATVAVWTPTRPITVKRLEFFTPTGVSSWLVGSAPLTGCSTAPLFTLTDGTKSVVLTVVTDGTGRYSTVGPISVSFPARAQRGQLQRDVHDAGTTVGRPVLNFGRHGVRSDAVTSY